MKLNFKESKLVFFEGGQSDKFVPKIQAVEKKVQAEKEKSKAGEGKAEIVTESEIKEKIDKIENKIKASPVSPKYKDQLGNSLKKVLEKRENDLAKIDVKKEEKLKKLFAEIETDLENFDQQPEVAEILKYILPLYKNKEKIQGAMNLPLYSRKSEDWKAINSKMQSIGFDQNKISGAQKMLGITADGAVGPETIRIINEQIYNQPYSVKLVEAIYVSVQPEAFAIGKSDSKAIVTSTEWKQIDTNTLGKLQEIWGKQEKANTVSDLETLEKEESEIRNNAIKAKKEYLQNMQPLGEVAEIPPNFLAINRDLGLSVETMGLYYKAYLQVPEEQRISPSIIGSIITSLRENFLVDKDTWSLSELDDSHKADREQARRPLIEAFGKLINGQRENLISNETLAVNVMKAKEKYQELEEVLKEEQTRLTHLEGQKEGQYEWLAKQVTENPGSLNFWTPSTKILITQAIENLGKWDKLINKQESKISGIKKEQQSLLSCSLTNQYQLLKNTGENPREVLLSMHDTLGDNAPVFLKSEIDNAVVEFQADSQASEVQKLIYAGKYDEALNLLGQLNKERTNIFDNDVLGNHDLIEAHRGKEESPWAKSSIVRLKSKPGFPTSFAAQKIKEGYTLKGVDDNCLCLMKEGIKGSLSYIRIDENGERMEIGKDLVNRSNKEKLLEKFRAEKDSETTKRMTALIMSGKPGDGVDAKQKIREGYVAIVMGSTEGGSNLLVYLMKENSDGSVNCIETNAGGHNLRILAAADYDISNSRNNTLINSFRNSRNSLQTVQLKEKFPSKSNSFAAQKIAQGYVPMYGHDLNKTNSHKGISNDAIYLMKENINGSLNYIAVKEDGSKGDQVIDAETIADSDKQDATMKEAFQKILREKPSFKALGAASKDINAKFAPLQMLFYKTLEGNKPGNFIELAKGYAREVKDSVSSGSIADLRSNLAQARADLNKLKLFGETGMKDEFEQKILSMENQLSQVAALVDSKRIESFCNMILSADFEEDSFDRWMIKDALPFIGAILTATVAIVLICTGVGSGVGGLMLMAGVGTLAGMAGNELATIGSNYIGKAVYGEDGFTNKTMLGKYITDEKVFNPQTGQYEEISSSELNQVYGKQFVVGFVTTFALLGCGQIAGKFLSKFAAANGASPGFKGMAAKLLSKIPKLRNHEINLLNQKGLGNMMNKLGREFLEETREEMIESAAEKGHPALGFLASLYHCLNGGAVSYKMGKYKVVSNGASKTGDNEVSTNWSYDQSQRAEFIKNLQAEYGKNGFKVEVSEDGTVTAETTITLKDGSVAKNKMIFKPTTESLWIRQLFTEGLDETGKSEIKRLYGLKQAGENKYEFTNLSPEGKIALTEYLKNKGFVINGDNPDGSFTAIKGNEMVSLKAAASADSNSETNLARMTRETKECWGKMNALKDRMFDFDEARKDVAAGRMTRDAYKAKVHEIQNKARDVIKSIRQELHSGNDQLSVEDLYKKYLQDSDIPLEQQQMIVATISHMINVRGNTVAFEAGLSGSTQEAKDEALKARLIEAGTLHRSIEGKIAYKMIDGVLCIRCETAADYAKFFGDFDSHTSAGLALSATESGIGIGIIVVKPHVELSMKSHVIIHELQHIYKQGSNSLEPEMAIHGEALQSIRGVDGNFSILTPDGDIRPESIHTYMQAKKAFYEHRLKDEALAFLVTEGHSLNSICNRLLNPNGSYDYLGDTEFRQMAFNELGIAQAQASTKDPALLEKTFNHALESTRDEYLEDAQAIVYKLAATVEFIQNQGMNETAAREYLRDYLMFVPLSTWEFHLNNLQASMSSEKGKI